METLWSSPANHVLTSGIWEHNSKGGIVQASWYEKMAVFLSYLKFL